MRTYNPLDFARLINLQIPLALFKQLDDPKCNGPAKSGTSIISTQAATLTIDAPIPPSSHFDWLRRARSQLEIMIGPVSDTALNERMLQPDRTAAATLARHRIGSVLNQFSDEVYSPLPGNRLHLLLGPTGCGKTSATLAFIAEDPRTYQFDDRDDGPGPIVFLLPTYANIGELRARADQLDLDGSLDDAALAAQAGDRGIVAEDQVDEYVDSIRHKRMKTVIYRGKVAAGCKRAAEVEQLMSAGLPTAGLCRSKMLKGGETEERFCPFYSQCEAILQRATLQSAHIVFAPRSFLDLRLPPELEKVRAVICDESVYSLLVHSTVFPLSVLSARRDAPKLHRREIDARLTPESLLMFRALAAKVVTEAMLAGRDPALALREHVLQHPDYGHVKGAAARAARFAARVVGAGFVDRSRINPRTTAEQVSELCVEPRGLHIRSEHRFWSTIRSRLNQLDDGQVAGDDVSIQLLHRDSENPMIRVSWLSKPNWAQIPVLLLDASGDAEITGRVFPGREIVVHEVPVDANIATLACIDRRFAIRNICPGRDARPEALFAAARLVHEIRCVLAAICGAHAYGRVLAGMPKKVRKAVQLNWAKPLNLDFLHSGAESGLDFARRHVAVVSIGRLELPISEIDAQVAALTSKDANPEQPIDRLGTGLDEDGIGIYPHVTTKTIRMRDGSDVSYLAHEHAGPIARRVQIQVREEKIRQLVGRLRPVYRGDAPACYIIGQSVPDDLIVDEFCAWEDLVRSGAAMWDVVRKAGGVLSASLMVAADQETGTERRYQTWIDSLPLSVTDGYHGIQVAFDTGGGMRPIGIPGHIPDVAGHLGEIAAEFAMTGEAQFDDVRHSDIVSPAAPEGKPQDDIEDRLGDRAARQAAELAGLAKVRDVVIRRGEWRPAKGSYRAGWGELEMKSAPLGVWAAMDSLGDSWIYRDDLDLSRETGAVATA